MHLIQATKAEYYVIIFKLQIGVMVTLAIHVHVGRILDLYSTN